MRGDEMVVAPYSKFSIEAVIIVAPLHAVIIVAPLHAVIGRGKS